MQRQCTIPGLEAAAADICKRSSKSSQEGRKACGSICILMHAEGMNEGVFTESGGHWKGMRLHVFFHTEF